MPKTEAALLDSGATENFLDPWMVTKFQLPMQKLWKPQSILNIDGTHNKAGSITRKCQLEVQFGDVITNIVTTTTLVLWADDLEEGMLGLVSRADTGGLLLLSLQFDSQFALWLAIDCWTSSVTSLPYALDPDFVTPQIAVVLDHSLYSVP